MTQLPITPPQQGPPSPTTVSGTGSTLLRVAGPYVLLGIATSLLAAGGVVWLVNRPEPRRVEIIIPTPAPVIVQVAGAVAAPGVYEFSTDARVQDAIAAAGGPLEGASVEGFNLAARLIDGTRIEVPVAAAGSEISAPGAGIGSVLPGDPASVATPLAASVVNGPAYVAQTQDGSAYGSANAALLDLNTATYDQLVALPGIGDVRARAVLSFRSTHGAIQSVDELLQIEGIGSATVNTIRPLVLQK